MTHRGRGIQATHATGPTGGGTARTPRRWAGFARGAAEALGIVGLFVAGGLAWAAQLGGEPGGPHPGRYLPAVEDSRPAPELWLVDGYNVLSVGLLAGRTRHEWWTHRSELLERVERFDADPERVWVVFDGVREPEGPPPGRARVVFAPDADAWLLDRIRRHRERSPGPVALVTADRRLAARARRRGAEVVSPGEFLGRCPTCT